MALQSSPRRTIALASALLLCSAGLGEVALRRAAFDYPCSSAPTVAWSPERDPGLSRNGLYQRDARQIWRPVPGAEVPWAPGEHLDSSGFRSEETPRERTSGVPRIAILGSDEAFGPFLPRENTWPALLRQSLEADGARVEVLCAAVEGSTLRQGLERWREEVRAYAPDLVLCTFAGEKESRAAYGCCTDAQRIRDDGGRTFPDGSHHNSPGLLQQVRVVQAGFFVADVLGGEYWTLRERKRSELRLRPAQDGITVPGIRRVPYGDCAALLKELVDEVSKDGARVLIVPVTAEAALRGQSEAVLAYEKLFLQVALELQVGRCSARELFEAALAAGARIEDFYTGGQLNEGGHRFLAQELGKLLRHRLSDLGR